MRSRSFAALAAVSVLVFAACGDDDEDAGGDSTAVVGGAATEPIEPPGADAATSAPAAAAETTPAAETALAAESSAPIEPPGADAATSAPAAAATAPGAGVETSAAGVEATAAVAGVDTTAAGVDTTAAGVETSAAGVETSVAGVETSVAGVEATAAVAGVDTTAAGVETSVAGVEATAAVAGVDTTAAGVETSAAGVETSAAAVETSVAAVDTAAAAADTTAAPDATIEAAGLTTEAADTTAAGGETTEAASETTTGATDSTAVAATGTTEAGAPESSAPGSAPATSASGSSVPAGEPGAITVGSANFPESELLAQIYGQALEAAGFDVSYEPGIGSREAYLGAIEGGEIGLIPEYTGSLLGFISDEPPTAANVDEQLTAIGEELPEGLEVLTPSAAEDKDTIVCTQEVVDEFSLTDLSSLFENSDNITLGAPPEFETRSPFGLAGFADVYDAEFAEFVPLAPGDIPAALEAGEIDCGNIFSTDPAIDTGGFVALEDDQTIVPNEAVLPLVRSELVTPEMTAALDEVNAALDTETLTSLLAQVVNDQLGADVVAAEFLASLGA